MIQGLVIFLVCVCVVLSLASAARHIRKQQERLFVDLISFSNLDPSLQREILLLHSMQSLHASSDSVVIDLEYWSGMFKLCYEMVLTDYDDLEISRLTGSLRQSEG